MTIIIPEPEDKDQEKGEYWYRILKIALNLPGARIDRASFLQTELSKHFPEEVVKRAIETRPANAGIPKSTRYQSGEC